MTEMQSTADVSQPISQGGGESPVSWDQLESVGNFKAEVAKSEAKEELQAERAAKKELGTSNADKDTESSEKKADRKTDPKEPKAKTEADTANKAEAKRLKIQHGEEAYDLPLEAKVPVKIDGKVEQVSLSEALARYSQQKHLDKIYTDYKKEKAAFEQERGKMNSMMTQVHDLLVNKKDIRGFIETVAEPLGLDPTQVYQDTVRQLENSFEEAQLLSPEERKAKTLEEELSYYRRKQEEVKTKANEAKSRQVLEAQVESVISQTGMDKAAFVKSYDELIKLGFEASTLSPEQIGSYYRNMQTINRIETKLTEKNPELAQDGALIEKLANLAFQTQATPEEIDQVIEQLYTSEAEQKLSKKINKSIRKNQSETPVKNPSKDLMFFDEL
jgi:hypothetical protein